MDKVYYPLINSLKKTHAPVRGASIFIALLLIRNE